jgi:hypothetical protein
MSKVDPASLSNLDRKSTLLLQAARQRTEQNEKSELSGLEDPGMDALRGSFGTVGSMIRARSISRFSMSTSGSVRQRRRLDEESRGGLTGLSTLGLANLPRHQLYDAPMPDSSPNELTESISMQSQQATASNPAVSSPRPHIPTIRFEEGDIAHYYPSPGKSGTAIHEPRERIGSTLIPPTEKEETRVDEEYTVPVTRTLQTSPERAPHPPYNSVSSESLPDTDQSSTSLFSPSTPTLPETEDVHTPREATRSHPLLSPRRRRGTSGRSYPGGNSSSEEEQEARASLVQGQEEEPSSPSLRGGIRLVPNNKNTPPRRI